MSSAQKDYNNDGDCEKDTTSQRKAAVIENDEDSHSDSSAIHPNASREEPQQRTTILDYTKHEFSFVVIVGILLSFNGGYVNGSCLSGLLTASGKQQSVAGFTGAYTKSALFLAESRVEDFGFQICMILSFMFGAMVTGIITPRATPFRIEPTYGPTFLLGGILLTASSILAALGEQRYFFMLAAAANGIQNGMTSIYSKNLIRSSHFTGNTTDIGLFVGQLIRGNRDNLWKLHVLLSLTFSFWTGGLVSFYATSYFTSLSLLFNAGLFLLIGLALVFFLVHELHISIKAAISGTWIWQKIFDEIEEHLRQNMKKGHDFRNSEILRSHHFANYYESLIQVYNDSGREGLRDVDLCLALNEQGIEITLKDTRILMKIADKDKSGQLSKEEFLEMARLMISKKGSSRFLPFKA
jgi:uncharacterized membrane protein YoaK (UPF0700 family)